MKTVHFSYFWGMENKRSFASDNNSGVHHEYLEAISDSNNGHVIGYGDDIYTENAIKQFKSVFGNNIEVFFTFLGTAANVLGLNAITNTFNAIICAESSHIYEDECGAVERFGGVKLLPIKTDDGKLRISDIKEHLKGIGFEHHSQPSVISITQATEFGTVYTKQEIKEIADFAHNNNLLLHMDGARIANAAISLDMSFKEFTADAGVDVLSFGGTKNGMMYGEAIIFFDKKLATNFKYIRKQGMQLASKMRYISAQFSAYLKDSLWKETATHANLMAQELKLAIEKIPEISIVYPVQSNGVFAKVPRKIISKLQNEYFFYEWDENENIVRWMCSWDTTKNDVDIFASKIKELLNK